MNQRHEEVKFGQVFKIRQGRVAIRGKTLQLPQKNTAVRGTEKTLSKGLDDLRFMSMERTGVAPGG